MFSSELKDKYPSATKFFELAINKEHVANSYAFIGNNSSEIERFVVYLASILNCEKNPFSKPCGSCINCNWLSKNEHPQALITVEPDSKSKKGQIKIDDIRELLSNLRNQSRFFRVVYFKNASMVSLSAECCNLLLKIVEEAPTNTIFIFSCSSKEDILPTILSRSQTVYLNSRYEFPANNTYSIKDLTSIFSYKEVLDKLDSEGEDFASFLKSLAFNSYKDLKFDNQKTLISTYENINKSYLKKKAFMQDKVIVQDLILGL